MNGTSRFRAVLSLSASIPGIFEPFLSCPSQEPTTPRSANFRPFPKATLSHHPATFFEKKACRPSLHMLV